MVESLQKLREPAAVVVLVVLVLRLVLAVVELVVAARVGAGDGLTGPTLAFVAVTAVDALTVVVLALLLAACVLWRPTRHARALTLVGAVVVGLTLLLSLAAVVASIATSGSPSLTWVDLSRAVLALPVPALALLGLLRLLQSRRAGARSADQPSLAASPEHEAEQPALESAPDPANQPTWQPDQAAGAAWLTAGDAAAGAAATRWGRPDDAEGWQPRTPAPDDPDGPTPWGSPETKESPRP